MNRELVDVLVARLRGLPPPERRPRAGGAADDLVMVMAAVQAQSAEDALRLVWMWLASITSLDGLRIIAKDRYLHQYPDEPIEVFRARVVGAFDFWETAGTMPGMVLALRQAGYQAQVIEHFRDPDQAHWAEFSLVVKPLGGVQPGGSWDDGATWDGGTAWNFKLPATPLSGLLDLIREIKPAHARLRQLLLDTWENTWDGSGIWGADEALAVMHNWGSPWGLPSVSFVDGTSPGVWTWDENRYEVIYQMEELQNAKNN